MRWLITIIALLLGGCADLGYYWHSASGHLAVMNQRVDIDDLLADDTTPDELRERLLLVKRIRRFSVDKLKLPDNDSYASYVELDRPYVVQNIFAAPEFSIRLHQWCYPIVGCASYRGYYDEDRLQAYANKMRDQGFEVHVGRVSAYSTLGWFDDPVLSSFINWSDHRLAGLLFHELTHQQIFIDGDTRFNESLASAVQQAGTELWLKQENQLDRLQNYHRWLRYRREVIDLIQQLQQQLSQMYSEPIDDREKREHKQAFFEAAKRRHGEIAARYGIKGGFTRWFNEELNNAKIGSVAAYNAEVPAFLAMLQARDYDFEAFYQYVEALGELDKPRRDECLAAWKANSDNELPLACLLDQ